MFQSTDVWKQQVTATFPAEQPKDLFDLLNRSQAAWKEWQQTSLENRSQLLLRVAGLLEEKKSLLALCITEETGKRITESEAEIDKCARLCRETVAKAAEWLATEHHPKARIRYDAQGIVLAIMPWNFPFWQVFRCAVPNLIAGNGIWLKHAYSVPRCARWIEEIFTTAGLPPPLFRNVFLLHEDTGALLAHPLICGVAFTGSESGGRQVAALAGHHLKKSVLELGGSDPFIVCEDADLQAAARAAVASRLICTGQSCIAAKRFLVHIRLFNPFLEVLQSLLSILQPGNPVETATTLGLLSSPKGVETLGIQVRESLRKGAKQVLFPSPALQHPCFFSPVIITGIVADMPLYRQETFGPVFSVWAFTTLEEACQLAAGSPYALGASVWTHDPQLVHQLERELRYGTLAVNTLVQSDPLYPFGGQGISGYGRELGREGMREFLSVRTVRMG